MPSNPVENNFVTRFILGFAVIFAMSIGGGIVGQAFGSFEVPYAEAVGVALGALLVFAAFAAWYTRYDASFRDDQD